MYEWGGRLKKKNKLFKIILQFLVIMLVAGYFTSNIIQTTFATNVDKSPNVIVNINGDGSMIQQGDLFAGSLLFPSSVQDAENGIGSIKGVIRLVNNYGKVDINNLAIGLKSSQMEIRNNYQMEEVFDSFLDNIRLKIEKGSMFSFDKILVDYTSLRNFLYEPNDTKYGGLALNNESKFSINKGDTIDLKYTLQMIEEVGNELQSVTAHMPIYINLRGNHIKDEDNDDDQNFNKDDEETIVEITELIPQAGTHWAHDCIITLLNHKVIQGYPHEDMTIEDYFNGTVDPVTYVYAAVQPEKYITRAEAATLVGKALGLQEGNSLLTGYVDSIPNWARGYIIATTKVEIFEGYPFKLFKPNKYITREEMIAVLTRAWEIGLEDNDLELLFTDREEISLWAMENVKAGFEKTIIQGYPDNTYKPKNNITRAEAFTIICKLMGLHDEHTIDLP